MFVCGAEVTCGRRCVVLGQYSPLKCGYQLKAGQFQVIPKGTRAVHGSTGSTTGVVYGQANAQALLTVPS
jgi:hypothetical protein